MNNLPSVEEVEAAAKKRGAPPAPRDYITQAIWKVKQGFADVPRAFFSRRPTEKGIYDLAIQLLKEAQSEALQAEEDRTVTLSPKAGNGAGATFTIFVGKHTKRKAGMVRLDDGDEWEIVDQADGEPAEMACKAALKWAAEHHPFG